MVTAIWVMFFISLIILVISFIMSPTSNSFSGAIVGSSDLDLFKVSKERGSKKILKWTMFFLGFLLLLFSIIARIIVNNATGL